MYVQRIRSRIDRKVLIDPKLRRILEDRNVNTLSRQRTFRHCPSQDVDTTDEKEMLGMGLRGWSSHPFLMRWTSMMMKKMRMMMKMRMRTRMKKNSWTIRPTMMRFHYDRLPAKTRFPVRVSPKRRKQLLESLDYVYLASLEPWTCSNHRYMLSTPFRRRCCCLR
ncbi:hypothetical protein BC829DRAFT_31274 [Chytridium lagenaria]|nr:hypothetical protein BC829DRAFT_31274 [Chytridium lagenaria]